MSVLFIIAIALLVNFVGRQIATYFKYPPILGQFLSSFFLAIPIIKESLFNQESLQIINTFSELAIVFLLLLAGLRTNLHRLNLCKKEASIIALLSIVIPFIGGFMAGQIVGFNSVTSLILGFCLSITAEGTNLAILLQLRKIRTKVGSIVISAGMINDLFGILFLSIALILSHQNSILSLGLFPIKLILFILIVWLFSYLLPKAMSYFEERKKEVGMFNVIILSALILAILSEIIGLSAILGAFVAGILLQKSFLLKRDERHEEHEMETLLFGLIIPFFFIKIAFNFDFNIIVEQPWLIIATTIIAITGKIIGSMLAKPLVKLKPRQLYLIGWEMNSRGMIELIIAEIALIANLIPANLYSVIIATAVISTLISPFFVRNIIQHHPKIMSQ